MHQTSLLKKIITCFLAGLTASFATQRIIYRTIWEFKNKWIPPPVFAAACILSVLIIVMMFAIAWHRNENKKQTGSPATLAFWQGVLRYFIAIDLSMIGWQKIFHLQFFTPLGILDQPFSGFSGEQLTWAYFGHSYAFTCVVGLLQIAGSYLLLFKRTKLFGSFILFPVLLNIVFIDLFYGLEAGELAHALILLLGIIYLLLQEYNKLVELFFLTKSTMPDFHFKKKFIQNFIKLSVLLIPLLLIFSYGPPDKNPQLTGKYSVHNLFINQKPVAANSCQDSVLTIIYFDKENNIVFEFNSQQRRFIGSYQFGRQNKNFTAEWRYPVDQKNAFAGTLISNEQNQLVLSGKMGNDSLHAVLLKNK
ncbi:MAG: hypothetical protein JST87_17765 [Bacteroidetes bacterium]|nr:hypothetical protein [Bacteroidota bacterium]